MTLVSFTQMIYTLVMCRIFGFRSVLQSGVHKSLVDSKNSILHQSHKHPDGWGVAYYKIGTPHIVKLGHQARECKIFEKVSGVVSSNTVVAHIRKSTVGSVGPLNTHPFQFGPWIFAHNGNVEHFQTIRPRFLECIDQELRSFILGETDSEHLFFLLLSLMKKRGQLDESVNSFEPKTVMEEFIELFKSLAGPLSLSKKDNDKNYISFVLTNGKSMLAYHGGKELFFSTHKRKCSERDTCSHFKPLCESYAANADKVQHFLVSSEKIANENIWTALNFGEMTFINNHFIFQRQQIGH